MQNTSYRLQCYLFLAILFLTGCALEASHNGAKKGSVAGLSAYTCPNPKIRIPDFQNGSDEVIVVNNGKENIIQELIDSCRNHDCGKCQFSKALEFYSTETIVGIESIEYSSVYPFGHKIRVDNTEYVTDTSKCLSASTHIQIHMADSTKSGHLTVFATDQKGLNREFRNLFVENICK